MFQKLTRLKTAAVSCQCGLTLKGTVVSIEQWKLMFGILNNTLACEFNNLLITIWMVLIRHLYVHDVILTKQWEFQLFRVVHGSFWEFNGGIVVSNSRLMMAGNDCWRFELMMYLSAMTVPLVLLRINSAIAYAEKYYWMLG